MYHKTHLFCLLFCVIGIYALAQSTDPMLTLNTPMHTSTIRRIATDAQGKYLLTCSEDKTAKLWDVTTGNRLQTYRPPIGEGNVGKLYAAALSPDGKTVVIGGFSTGARYDDIYFFNANTGQLQHRIGGLANNILDLEFSPDGKYLAVSLLSDGIRVYEANTFSLVFEDKNYGGNSHNIAFDKNKRLASASFDGYIRLYDANFNLLKKIKPGGGKMPHSLAFSPDARMLAVGYYDSPHIQVLDANDLSLLYQPDITNASTENLKLNKVAFSLDGKYLVAGGHYRLNNKGDWWFQIRVWENAGRGNYQDYSASRGTITDIKPLPNGNFAYGGFLPDWGILNLTNGNLTIYKAGEINQYNDSDKSHFRISEDGSGIGVWPLTKNRLSFDLRNRSFKESAVAYPAPTDAANRIKVTNWESSRKPFLNGRELNFLATNERTLSVDVAQDRIVFGADWNLYCLDDQGRQIWKTRTQAPAWCVNVSDNNKMVATALGDGTIRWYRMSDGELLLTLFLHPDNKRWVLWTPSGYYDAAPGAESLIGWHVNQGADKEALYYPMSRFRDSYYRSDVIDRILDTQDEAEALRQADEVAQRRTVTRNIVQEQPPTVRILSPATGSTVQSNTVKVAYSLQSPNGAAINNLTIQVNNRPVTTQRGLKPAGTKGEATVIIPSEDCTISILAENRFGVSEAATIQLKWGGSTPAQAAALLKPKLYILAIGVSNYKNPDYKLNFAAKDAKDFAQAMLKQKGLLYGDVVTEVLTDGDATKNNILSGLDWLQKQTTSRDVAMLFFAGHGIDNNVGVFYYLPVDGDAEDLRVTGIMKEEIKQTVATVAGKIVVFMDACHSGNLMKATMRRDVTNIDRIINELITAENGAVVFSSSSGRQYSLEDPTWGNGAFTKALVEGLNGKANLFNNGKITVKTLDAFVTGRVKELTNGEQSPTTNFPPNVEDFPIAIIK